jgi:hypothetical protein
MIKFLQNRVALLLGAMLFVGGLKAQLQVVTINASSPTICDGIAYFSDSTQVNATTVLWQGGGAVVQQGGASAFNLCPGTYTVTYTTLNSSAAQTYTFTIGSTGSDPCANFSAVVYATNDTTLGAPCNGTAWVSVTGGTAPYTYWWSNGQNTGNQIGGLCPGDYGCFVVDANGCQDTMAFTVTSSTFNPCAGFTAGIQVVNATDSISCDGAILILPTGGTAPYNVMWNGVVVNATQITNLCPGSYVITVGDSNNCTTSVIGTVNYSSSTSGDTLITIDNNSYPDSIINGTLGSAWYMDCLMDLAAIDSAYISNFTYTTGDSISVTWMLVNNGTPGVEITVSYFTGGANGVYNTILTVFCPQKSTGIHYLQITDQVYLTSAGVNELNESMFTCTNPIENSMQLNFKKAATYAIEVVDIKGSCVFKGKAENVNQFTIDASNFGKGTYFVKVADGTSLITKKIVK